MARVEFDLSADGPFSVDDGSLAAALAVELQGNARDALSYRTNCGAVTYYAGRDSTTFAIPPPDGDADITGVIGDGSYYDEFTEGLYVSSPPNGPILLPLGEFPLGAHETQLAVTVGAFAAVAEVEVQAFAVVNGQAVPPPAIEVDEQGLASLVNGLTVGTTTPSGTQFVSPIRLTVDIAARDESLARGPTTGPARCDVWLAIQSKAGSTYATTDVGWTGRVIDTDLGKNVGPVQEWLLRDDDRPQWHGVLSCLTGTRCLVHPPVPVDGTYSTAAYYCGILVIHAVTVRGVP